MVKRKIIVWFFRHAESKSDLYIGLYLFIQEILAHFFYEFMAVSVDFLLNAKY